jgi:hypothetical protein
VTNFSATNASIQTLYSNGTVTATGTITGGSFNATSDKRVKTNMERLNSQVSLEIVRELKPTKFDFIGACPNQIGFIAQDIKQIPFLRSSVQDEGTGFIPNIYRIVTCENGWFASDVLLTVNDKIRYKKEGTYRVTTIVSSKDSIYQLSDSITGDFFIYGTEVHDFHSIQKDMVFTLAVSAIQRLDEIVNQQQITIEQQQKTIELLLKKIDAIFIP